MSNGTNMSDMFNNANSFNQPLNTSGNKWNVSRVADMCNMFDGASLFNQPLTTCGNRSATRTYRVGQKTPGRSLNYYPMPINMTLEKPNNASGILKP